MSNYFLCKKKTDHQVVSSKCLLLYTEAVLIKYKTFKLRTIMMDPYYTVLVTFYSCSHCSNVSSNRKWDNKIFHANSQHLVSVKTHYRIENTNPSPHAQACTQLHVQMHIYVHVHTHVFMACHYLKYRTLS